MKIENCPPAGEAGKLKIAKHKGFTLIELMVSMAIVGILAATAIVNFSKNSDRDVKQEKDRLTSFLREVQNKALAGDRVGVAISGKVCGFGVHYDADSKNLQAYYANTSGPTSLDDDCLETSNVYDGNKTMAEKFIPGNGVSIDSFSEDIFFMSPTGDVYQANSTGGTNLIVDYSIGLTKGSSTSSAAITSGGIIK